MHKREKVKNQNQYFCKYFITQYKQRVAPTHYQIGQEVWIDVSVGKVGNARKLGINRKKGQILDKISQNAYTIKFDNGKVEPVNVERLYTLSRIKRDGKRDRIVNISKNSHRNWKRRAKKRKLKNITNVYPQQNKKHRST